MCFGFSPTLTYCGTEPGYSRCYMPPPYPSRRERALGVRAHCDSGASSCARFVMRRTFARGRADNGKKLRRYRRWRTRKQGDCSACPRCGCQPLQVPAGLRVYPGSIHSRQAHLSRPEGDLGGVGRISPLLGRGSDGRRCDDGDGRTVESLPSRHRQHD